jgi:hypothetical protein
MAIPKIAILSPTQCYAAPKAGFRRLKGLDRRGSIDLI